MRPGGGKAVVRGTGHWGRGSEGRGRGHSDRGRVSLTNRVPSEGMASDWHTDRRHFQALRRGGIKLQVRLT